MDFWVWFSFVLISAANIVTPGPAILNTVRRAAQLGMGRVFPTILGNTLGLAIAGSFCAGGVASFVLTSEILWSVFRWLGVGYLVWLGLKFVFKREEIDLSGDVRASVSGMTLFWEAFLLAVTNPKAILFFVALFPQVMRSESALLPQAAILVATFCGISVLSLCSYSALASLLRARFITQARYRRFRVVSGFVLFGFAEKIAGEVR
ncbi:Threonine/homoserine/homoserine lactone efflux protein [Pseudovibrio denitrificans]|uniref:Threonine/homoserine/homoserine lactone efflux protein n=1 Tax=Pseudovibrio denitrificans TaxID=258256 RepID=A0A1I6ZFW4_9HYPH|nr:LysE family translocator [Pseudovibrio denitrificans]SFT61584.1 Threonine/homoserine/homoserine lactone efflux protein [Pseudovibrio denitrificans]